MCCLLGQLPGRLTIQTLKFEENKNKQKIIYLEGIYDRTPRNWEDRFSLFFQRLEIGEKIAEIADECFHLFGSLFQQYTNLKIYETLRHLHHAAHDLEHILHAFCFFGDVTRLVNGKFLEYDDHKCTQLNHLRSLSRICHAVAHFFATAACLHELKLCSLERFEKIFKYSLVLSALGYALWTISLIWKRHQGIKNNHFASDMSIHLGGCLFEALSLTKNSFLLNRIASIAGIIHAWCVVQDLLSQNKEKITAHYVMSNNKDEQSNPNAYLSFSPCLH